MKNRIIYLFIMLVGVLACSDEFTEVPAYGALVEADLLNAQGVELALIGAYSLLDGNSNTGGSDYARAADGWWADVMSDDAHKGSTNSDQPALFDFETMNWGTTNGYLDARWVGLFAGINRSNAVLDIISKIPDGDFIHEIAQARFLRAHYNFELQIMWGNVPFISLENFQALEFNQPNPGPIWDQIEADMDFAMKNLPDEQNEVGRPNKWVATAYMGKIHLHQGEWLLALGHLETVIDGSPYSLLGEYADNFRLQGDNSEESLLAIQFTADSGLSYNGNIGGTLNFPGPFNCCGFYNPTQDLINAFQTANGLPLLDTYNQTDVNSDYGINSDEAFTPFPGELDPRLDYTVGRRAIWYNGYQVHPGKDWQRASFTDLSGPYTPKKNTYQAGEDDNVGAGGWGEQRSGVNYHILRYADVLLMAAEAAAETDDLGKALGYVNQVRERAINSTPVKAWKTTILSGEDGEEGTDDDIIVNEEIRDENGVQLDAANYKIELYPNFPSKDYAVKAVRFERRLEFGMEGKRLFDIRRWGNATGIMNAYFVNENRTITTFDVAPGAYDPHYDVSPIPLRAVDLSGNILNQNPQY